MIGASLSAAAARDFVDIVTAVFHTVLDARHHSAELKPPSCISRPTSIAKFRRYRMTIASIDDHGAILPYQQAGQNIELLRLATNAIC